MEPAPPLTSKQPSSAPETLRTIIVAPSRTDNSLGRALSLAEVYGLAGPVRILAFDDGPLWKGASASTHTVEPVTSVRDIAGAVSATPTTAVVTVKPFRRSLHWTLKALADGGAGARPLLIADLDDLDVAIHAEWHRELAPLRRAVSLVMSELSPLRIERRVRWLVPRADILTVSSWALRGCFPAFPGPEIRIPHPRSITPYEPPIPSSALRLGFLGTPLSYKGVEPLCQLVNARSDTELHVLAGTQDQFRAVEPSRIVVHEHRGAETLSRAFRHIDVVALPQDPHERASRYQLPAKFLDALRFGRPVVATGTPPIRELAAAGVITVADWGSLDAGLHGLQALSRVEDRERLGRLNAETWGRRWSAEAVVPEVVSVLRNLGTSTETPPA